MALTNQEILVRVRAGLSRGHGTSRTDQDTNIVQSINAAMEDMAKVVDYEDLRQNPVNITTVSGQRYLDCSSIITAGSHQSYDRVDMLYVLMIVDGSSTYKLEGMDPREFEMKFPIHEDTDRTGRPEWYTKRNQRIFFYPTPDDTYEIRTDYSLWPTPVQHSGGTITAGSSPGQASANCSINKSSHAVAIGATYHAAMMCGMQEIKKEFFPIFQKQIMDDLDKNGPKPDIYRTTGLGSVSSPKQTSGPSAGALAGTDSWDATYSGDLGWW